MLMYDMFDLFQPFVDSYFFIQRSFSLDFYAKNDLFLVVEFGAC